jgi:hypothetical protein
MIETPKFEPMSDWLQFGIVSLVVGGAGSYLVLRTLTLFRARRAGHCGGGCSGCPNSAAESPAGPALVQLEGGLEALKR